MSTTATSDPKPRGSPCHAASAIRTPSLEPSSSGISRTRRPWPSIVSRTGAAQRGRQRYPDSDRIVILADCGGSDGYRCRAWRQFLQTELCDRHGLRVTVAHYRGEASSKDPVGHRLFSASSRNSGGRAPLGDLGTVLNCIRTTSTKTGPQVPSVRVWRQCQAGVRISDRQMAGLSITKCEQLADWNYGIRARNTPMPPVPRPDRPAAT